MELTPKAQARFAQATGGHPHVSLLLGHAVVDVLNTRQRNLASVDVVDVAMGNLLATTCPVYDSLWALWSSKTRVVAALLAELGNASEADVQSKLNEAKAPVLPEEARRALRGLVRQGTVAEQGPLLRFTADLLRAWLVTNHPFESTVSAVLEFVGSFQILDVLGHGGMGVVYKARDLLSGQIVALKLLSQTPNDPQDARRRFMREAEMGLKIHHPHIVRTLARGEHEGRPYIAMEYLQGMTLRQYVRRYGPWPWRKAFELLASLADALCVVHQANAVHRDIKSDNIMLVGPERVPKLMDFGLTHWSDLSSVTRSHVLVGTLPYMSPEQVAGEEAQPSWDLYSLGVVLYEVLTGVLPFRYDSSIRLFKAITTEPPPPPVLHGVDLPEAVEQFLLKQLAKAPAERCRTATELRQACNDLLALE
jgi:hypothetical protein